MTVESCWYWLTFASLFSQIGLEYSCHILNQSHLKLTSSTTWSLAFFPRFSFMQFSLALVKLAFVITGCFWWLFSFWRTLSHQCHWKIILENHRPTQFKFAPTDRSVIHNARESTCLVCCRLHLKICSSTDYFNLSELANIKKVHLSSFSKLFKGL